MIFNLFCVANCTKTYFQGLNENYSHHSLQCATAHSTILDPPASCSCRRRLEQLVSVEMLLLLLLKELKSNEWMLLSPHPDTRATCHTDCASACTPSRSPGELQPRLCLVASACSSCVRDVTSQLRRREATFTTSSPGHQFDNEHTNTQLNFIAELSDTFPALLLKVHSQH